MILYVYMGFPGVSDGKESACNACDISSIPRSGRSPGRIGFVISFYTTLPEPLKLLPSALEILAQMAHLGKTLLGHFFFISLWLKLISLYAV